MQWLVELQIFEWDCDQPINLIIPWTFFTQAKVSDMDLTRVEASFCVAQMYLIIVLTLCSAKRLRGTFFLVLVQINQAKVTASVTLNPELESTNGITHGVHG